MNADMRIEIVKRELNQGALAGLGSHITDHAALGIITALDSYDQHAITTAVTAERERIRRLLALPVLHAVRSIPDGPVGTGCVTHDGARVREALRVAYREAVDTADTTPAPTEPSAKPTRAALTATCDGCRDDIWPGETVYTLPAGEVLCGVCHIRRAAAQPGTDTQEQP